MEGKDFQVGVCYEFAGHVRVRASSAEAAKRIVRALPVEVAGAASETARAVLRM